MDFNFEAPTIGAVNGDGRLIVIFENRPVRNNFKSDLEGRPIFETVEFVTIKVPGSKDEFTTKVTKEIKEKHADAYSRWKEKGQLVLQGTPLSSWPALDTALVATYKEMNVLTVEQLAEVSDGVLSKLPPGTLEWRKKAKAYLEYSKNAGQFVQIKTQLEDSKKENAELKERMKALEATMLELTEKKTKKAA